MVWKVSPVIFALWLTTYQAITYYDSHFPQNGWQPATGLVVLSQHNMIGRLHVLAIVPEINLLWVGEIWDNEPTLGHHRLWYRGQMLKYRYQGYYGTSVNIWWIDSRYALIIRPNWAIWQ